MWNGAGSVSPAGKACDWAGPCHCDSCVAKRGAIVPRVADAGNVLAQYPPGYAAKLIAEQLRDGYREAYPDGISCLTEECAELIAEITLLNQVIETANKLSDEMNATRDKLRQRLRAAAKGLQ